MVWIFTEREYWAQRKGQAKLDKEAAALPAEEQPAKPTKFEPKDFKFTGWHPFCICIATPIMMEHEEFAEWLLH